MVVAVVDPRAGYIEGNGWFTSPSVSYMPFAVVSFEFDARYEEADSVPSGQTKIHTIDWEFHSTSYEWLVVSDNGCAKLKGAGAMVKTFGAVPHGRPEYGFLLTICENASDIRKAPKDDHHSLDSIRIHVWSLVNGKIIYDNRKIVYDEADSFDHGTILGGGKIEIHRPKEPKGPGSETESGEDGDW
ncbi:MAG: hypothetical protein SGARI_001179 [Bacillariaceae sp.]